MVVDTPIDFGLSQYKPCIMIAQAAKAKTASSSGQMERFFTARTRICIVDHMICTTEIVLTKGSSLALSMSSSVYQVIWRPGSLLGV